MSTGVVYAIFFVKIAHLKIIYKEKAFLTIFRIKKPLK
jgi:hypothetical protein